APQREAARPERWLLLLREALGARARRERRHAAALARSRAVGRALAAGCAVDAGPPAVHEQHVAGHVARRVGREEEQRTDQLLDATGAAERRALLHPLLRALVGEH